MTSSSPARLRTWGRCLAGSLALGLGLATVLPSVGITPVAPAVAADATPVTITPNPAYQQAEFEGWGTSLVWFANATGDYPAEVRQDLFDKVFGDDGLRLNIARYNIGGGNATDVPSYLRAGGAVDGWWNPDVALSDAEGPITTEYADRDRFAAAWDAEDPASYDLDADTTQRWWLTALKDRITKWEAFSNSPPYFMTESGFVSGNFDAAEEQLKPESVDDFVTYLTTVVDHLEADTGIDFDTLDPFNEPNTDYWGTQLGADGWPTGGRQEGAHIGPQAQDVVIKALAERLAADTTTTDVAISAMDETNPGIFAQNWNGWSAEAKSLVDQLNVHSYGQGGSVVARDIAKTVGKPLWMSEVEGNWDTSGAGHNLTNIDNGIGLATHMIDDLRNLEPTAWVLWQPVEDKYNMEKVEKLNWGSVLIDFDCNADGESERRIADGDADVTCGVTTNAKYNTLRNFTHYVQPGDHLIPSTNAETTTAIKGDGSGVTLVHANPSTSARSVTVDLSRFGAIAPGAAVTPIITTESPTDDVTRNALVPGTAVPVDAATKSVTVTVPAKSVSTLVVTGVTGIAADAAPLIDGHDYQLIGAQSGKAATAVATVGTVPAASIATRASDSASGATQVWTAEKLTGGVSNSERYALRSSSGALLAANPSGTTLTTATRDQAASDPSLQWMLTTTDGRRWSLVNVATSQALEVPGQATADGSPVGVYQSNNGQNQAWTFLDTELTGIRPVSVSTIAGVPAALPSSVVPFYGQTDGAPVPVAWQTDGIDWNVPGTVAVTGTGTDGWGASFTTTASVDVGGFTATDPVSLTVAAETAASTVIGAAPGTVPAQIGASANRFDAPVTWDFGPLTDAAISTPGVVRVLGTATSNDPAASPLPALLSVIVTAGTARNIAPDATTTATATSTEAGYPVDRTRNGVTGDKGWSNWRSGTKSPSDTLTYDLGGARVVDRVAVFAYRDGNTTSWPASLTVQWLDSARVWQDAPGSPTAVPTPTDGTAPVVEVDLPEVAASQVRVVMTAFDNTHMVISEVEIYALVPSVASEAGLAALRVNGVAVPGFATDDLAYEVEVFGSAVPVVDALPVDENATVTITRPLAAAAQGSGSAAGAIVTVTAADGTTQSVTELVFDPTATVSVAIPAELRAGAVATASVIADPSDASVSYRWLRDGTPIAGAITVSYIPVAADVGATVSVIADASAPGYGAASAESARVVVLAAATVPGDGTGGGSSGGSTGGSGSTGGPGSTGGTGAGSGDAAVGSATPGTRGSVGSRGSLSYTGTDAPAGAIAAGTLALLIGGLLTLAAARARRRARPTES